MLVGLTLEVIRLDQVLLVPLLPDQGVAARLGCLPLDLILATQGLGEILAGALWVANLVDWWLMAWR